MTEATLPRTSPQAGYTLVELMVAITITMFVMAGVYGLMIQNQQIYESQTRLADAQQTARVAIDLMTREIRMAGSDPAQRAWVPDTACMTASYRTPTTPISQPSPDDIAPLTVAEAQKIRIKLDRPTYALGPEPTDTPTPTPSPSPMNDWSGDGKFTLDDEDGNGDGFLDDDEEDIEYSYDSAKKKLYRQTRRAVPAAACMISTPQPIATVGPKVPIAENVKDFKLKYYYAADPPTGACPTPGYSDYETARDLCDPTPSGTLDLTKVRRVRIHLVVETAKKDPLKPKKLDLTMDSDATIRNRLQ